MATHSCAPPPRPLGSIALNNAHLSTNIDPELMGAELERVNFFGLTFKRPELVRTLEYWSSVRFGLFTSL